MDTSETYILMSEKATEIQEVWFPTNLDYSARVYKSRRPFVRVLYGSFAHPHGNLRPNFKTNYVWLPRQDQLQAMTPKQYAENTAMISHLNSWIIDNDSYLEDTFAGNESMEQLWLAFVMHERYQKKWNGTDWVKE